MSFIHILERQSFGLQSFLFCLKMFKLSALLNSAGKSFQRIAPIVPTVEKPNFLVLVFRLFTLTPDLRL